MITLCVEPFCHYCEKFEPTVEKIFNENHRMACHVYCKHVGKCDYVAEYIEAKIKRSEITEKITALYDELIQNKKERTLYE